LQVGGNVALWPVSNAAVFSQYFTQRSTYNIYI